VPAPPRAAGLPFRVVGLGPPNELEHLVRLPPHRRGDARLVADGAELVEVRVGVHAVVRLADLYQHVVRDQGGRRRQERVGGRREGRDDGGGQGVRGGVLRRYDFDSIVRRPG
jgi:hypothetical protein